MIGGRKRGDIPSREHKRKSGNAKYFNQEDNVNDPNFHDPQDQEEC